jgi:hypothetical protein
MDENAPLNAIFEQTLNDRPQFSLDDLPNEWDVVIHRYLRFIDDDETTLDKKLSEFRELGVKVLDWDRRWGFIVFKTMAPS